MIDTVAWQQSPFHTMAKYYGTFIICKLKISHV
nr:unnamed protein product [Callosobruchus chinensis]